MLIDEEAVLRPRGDRTHNDLVKRLHAPRREVWRARPREVWVAKHAVVGAAARVDLATGAKDERVVTPDGDAADANARADLADGRRW